MINSATKILYIRKQIRGPFWKRWPKYIRDWYKFHHLEGFFRGSLNTQFEVDEMGINKFLKMTSKQLTEYDAIFLHYSCYLNSIAETDYENKVLSSEKALTDLLEKNSGIFKKVPSVLLLSDDSPEFMLADRILDKFELVFKREPLRDRDQYNISESNKEKIRPTVLSCYLVPATRLNYQKINPADYGHATPSDNHQYDASFVGTHTSELRETVVKQLINSNVNFHGGLQEKKYPVPENLSYPRIPMKKFWEISRNSKINLVLDGNGIYTYRHWEIWGLCCFMLCSSTIKQIELPFEVEENKHYIAFDKPKKLPDMISGLINEPEKITRIASAGRKLFEREYNFTRHGKFIEKHLQEIF